MSTAARTRVVDPRHDRRETPAHAPADEAEALRVDAVVVREQVEAAAGGDDVRDDRVALPAERLLGRRPVRR